jgi:hypothetical protein
MPSQAFLHRMEKVLASRVAQEVRRNHSRLAPLRRGLGVIGATLCCVIVLKAAAMAQGSQFSAPPPAEAGIGAQVAWWLGGADPVSSALATVLRSDATL